jgi:glycerophosphoryl diester phosphodiesterase
VRRIELPKPRSDAGFLIVAHRGNRRQCPENSIAAFKMAVSEGADLLETDIRITAEGAFICFHDPDLKRMTNGSGAVEQLSLHDLAAFSLRHQGRVWGEERIPSLEDLVAICPADVALALELKSRRFKDPSVCAAFVRELDRLGMRRRVIALSFHRGRLAALKRVAPDIPVGMVSFAPWPWGNVELLGPVLPILLLNRFYVREAHRNGYTVCPLDPAPESRIPYYRRLGVDALITDDPGSTIAASRRQDPDSEVET